MPVQKLKDYLDQNQVKFVTIRHSSAYTAQEIAAKAHIAGQEIAKTVMIKIDGKMAMAVLPATYQVNFKRLREIFAAHSVSLATETEFKNLFPDCEVGAMPPFGNLYDMEVFVAQSLTRDKEIAFNAGSHTELIRLSFADYRRLVQPKILQFSWKTMSLPGDPSHRWVEN